MKIFLTGANGYLGSKIVEDLSEEGHEIVLFSRGKPDEKWKDLEWLQGDCNDLKACIDAMSCRDIDVVMHVAAKPAPSDVKDTEMFDDIENVPSTMQTNVMGLYNMLQGALRAEIPVFVQTGSNCIMGHERRISSTPPEYLYLPLDEAHPGEPEDSYSVSKACGEIMLKAFSSAYGMKTYALRSGWIMNEDRRRLVASNRPNPTEDIKRVFNSYVALEDCSSAHVMIAEAAHEGKLPLHERYYVHADDSLALEPTMELIEKFRPDLLDKIREPLPGHAAFFSNKKLKEAVGWQNQLTWREFLS
jgi:nucleoside-diphosphate-sugar epimerase